jgi:hypothetical protein
MRELWINGLGANTSIETLALDDSRINDASMGVICRHWSSNSQITSLSVAYNLLRPKGALNLLNCIAEHHPMVERLNLSGNQNIDFEGLIQIGTAVRNTAIRKLFINCCVRQRIYYHHSLRPSSSERQATNMIEELPVEPIVPSGLLYPKTCPIRPTQIHVTQRSVNTHIVEQEALISRVRAECDSAINVLTETLNNGQVREMYVDSNGLDPEVVNLFEIRSLVIRFHLHQEWTTLHPHLWCIIFEKLRIKRFTEDLIYSFLIKNPALLT